MSDGGSSTGWFQNQTDLEAAIREGSADQPADWPELAVESGFAADQSTYYTKLQEVTTQATRTAIQDREQADDQQLAEAIKAMDDVDSRLNELAERVRSWGGSLELAVEDSIDSVQALRHREPESSEEERVVALAARVDDLVDERDALRQYCERTAADVAPNLSALAGPILAARLIALAGSLKELARMPSGTLQVLGAEDALFAHLRGNAPSPKHGVIYTHEAIRNTRPAERGSAARALAGKLTIAARVDYYAGDRRPVLDQELASRIATIQDREADQ